ncbi:TraR/DksA family transcriptional regulator [Spirochaeta isovalerica]|uniref:DnaK suppressor protein n=1 Tax=Spirochaeta isovalerica TaxID=150 RepID=A0A841RCY0_9SPIO|nr:TraR/DksA C4-type zinc finger protein [Spirochaeta isovalerica]MBB6480850.1 DnaK suppressor protein [Spirochaeta isovalerica]
MTELELLKFRKQIEEGIEEILRRMPFLKEEARGNPYSCSIGKVSWMDSQNDKGISEQLLRESKLRLEKLRNAMMRIENGTYGICIRCGNAIPPGRLEIIPEVLLCLSCAEKKK